MKVALIFFSVLTSLSLWFAAQETTPVVCRGKPLSIELLEIPGLPMSEPLLPLRFGGTRRLTLLHIDSENPFRLVIKNRDELSDFWKRLTAKIRPGRWVPPLPEIDFSKEMVIAVGVGTKPRLIIIDGACEVDGRVELFVSNIDTSCVPQPGIVTARADAVRIPKTDLPIVFRETEIGCTQWFDQLRRWSLYP